MVFLPQNLNKFVKLFELLTYTHEANRVFNDLLDYIIMGFSLDDSMTWDKKYTKSEIKTFYRLFQEWVLIMQEMCKDDQSWYDVFGTFYESYLTSNWGRKGSGQFFTPKNVCDAMVMMTIPESAKDKRLSINDPSCGSGRTLLAAHIYSPRSYLVAQDLDLTCVKMTICNFMIHGVVGEVWWTNSLTGEFMGAWKVNEALNILKVPHVRRIKQCETYGYVEAEESVEIDGNLKQKVNKPVKPKMVTLDDFKVKSEGK